MKKVLAIILSIVFILGTLAGCSGNNTDITSDGGVNSGNNITKHQKTPESISEAYLEALMQEDYATALKTFGLEEEAFVTAEDVEWYLPRSSVSKISNIDYQKYKIESEAIISDSKDVADVIVTISDKESITFNIKVRLNNENKWVVDGSEFYYTDFLFKVPGGKTETFINEVKVPDSLISNNQAGSVGLTREYTIQKIGKKDVEVRVKSGNFDYVKTLSPSANNEISDEYEVLPIIEDNQKYFDYIKNTWNELCAKYLSGENKSCVEAYISSNGNYEICTDVWTGFESLHNKGGYKNEDYNFSTCKKSERGDVYWLSDDVLCCYFDYELTWIYGKGTWLNWNESTRRNSNILLKVENGEIKMHELLDKALFSAANSFTHEW